MKTKREFYEEYLYYYFEGKILQLSLMIIIILSSIMFGIKEKNMLTTDTIFFILVIFISINGLFVLIFPSFIQVKKIAIKEKNNLEKNLAHIQNKHTLKNTYLDEICQSEIGQNKKEIIEYNKLNKSLKTLEEYKKEIEYKLEIIGEDPTMDR
jgi:hypothetical protein